MRSAAVARVTAIKPQKKRRNRVSLFLDGEFALGLHQDVLLKAGIAQGDELEEAQVSRLAVLDQERQAKEKAFRLLAVRARSKKELVDRLARESYCSEIIDNVIKDLGRIGLIDDAEFAASFARHRMATKPVGEKRLRLELRRKGVAEADIDRAVDVAFSEMSEAEYTRRLAIQRKRTCASLEERAAQKRVADYLLRRGFHWDVIRELLSDWEAL